MHSMGLKPWETADEAEAKTILMALADQDDEDEDEAANQGQK